MVSSQAEMIRLSFLDKTYIENGLGRKFDYEGEHDSNRSACGEGVA